MVNRVTGKKSRIFKPSFSVQSPTTRIWKIIYSSSASSLAFVFGFRPTSIQWKWMDAFILLKKKKHETKTMEKNKTKSKQTKCSISIEKSCCLFDVCLFFVSLGICLTKATNHHNRILSETENIIFSLRFERAKEILTQQCTSNGI